MTEEECDKLYRALAARQKKNTARKDKEMKAPWQEFRLLLCETLLRLVILLAPKEHTDGQALVLHIREYASSRMEKLP
mgnify:CR=1 FL=1